MMETLVWVAKNNEYFFAVRFLKHAKIFSFGKYSLVFGEYDSFIPEKDRLRSKILDLEAENNELKKLKEQT